MSDNNQQQPSPARQGHRRGGSVAGIGTYDRELLASCPVYHEIALSQLSEEELA